MVQSDAALVCAGQHGGACGQGGSAGVQVSRAAGPSASGDVRGRWFLSTNYCEPAASRPGALCLPRGPADSVNLSWSPAPRGRLSSALSPPVHAVSSAPASSDRHALSLGPFPDLQGETWLLWEQLFESKWEITGLKVYSPNPTMQSGSHVAGHLGEKASRPKSMDMNLHQKRR